MRIGVLALQGSFREHAELLDRLEAGPFLVRQPEHLVGLDGLIMPGGESTTIGKLLERYGLVDPIRALAACGLPIYGTCAGMILLARRVLDWHRSYIGIMDITVRRNAFGRQLDSFEECLSIPVLGREPLRAVFIRAPLIEEVGAGVRVLARLNDGATVAAEQANLLVSAFHPELTDDLRMHGYLVRKARSYRESRGEMRQAAVDACYAMR